MDGDQCSCNNVVVKVNDIYITKSMDSIEVIANSNSVRISEKISSISRPEPSILVKRLSNNFTIYMPNQFSLAAHQIIL